MATYRYFNVIRDIYEKCSNKKLHKVRSFADMKRLFKAGYWIMLIAMVISAISYLTIFFFASNLMWCFIPFSVMILVSIFSEFFGGKMYSAEARKEELQKHSESLEEYIDDVKTTLSAHKITTRAQRDVLKAECEKQIELHNKNFKSVSGKICDMLIGVPLGALISALIYKSSSEDTVIASIVALIVLGLMVIGISSFIKKVAYYSEGHFKDQHLLNVLNELEYLDD